MKVHAEVTDTYGHEANYSWVRRYTLDLPDTLSDYAVIRRIKREIGWSGKRCVTTHFSDTIELRPHGECVVCFVVFE